MELGAVEQGRGVGLGHGHQEIAWGESDVSGRGACGLGRPGWAGASPVASPCALFRLWSRRGQAGCWGTLALWFRVQPSVRCHRPRPVSKSVGMWPSRAKGSGP